MVWQFLSGAVGTYSNIAELLTILLAFIVWGLRQLYKKSSNVDTWILLAILLKNSYKYARNIT